MAAIAAYAGIDTDTLHHVFGDGDCEHLASALAEKYDVEIVVLGDDTGGWYHALVQDPSTGLYIDISGVHDQVGVESCWDGWDGWDGIYPASEVAWSVGDRFHPEVPVAAGVALVEDLVERYGISLTPRA